MLQLNKLVRLVKKRKRIGRGGARGGTSGRGHKGQKARSGAHVSPRFEGGQMPIYRRLPKRGFSNKEFAVVTEVVNIARLDDVFQQGAVVDRNALVEQGLIRIKKGMAASVKIKILGNGKLTKKLTIIADAFSKSAEQAIKKAGGDIQFIKEM
jgi:large subunit ribosomal protein L15